MKILIIPMSPVTLRAGPESVVVAEKENNCMNLVHHLPTAAAALYICHCRRLKHTQGPFANCAFVTGD